MNAAKHKPLAEGITSGGLRFTYHFSEMLNAYVFRVFLRPSGRNSSIRKYVAVSDYEALSGTAMERRVQLADFIVHMHQVERRARMQGVLRS